VELEKVQLVAENAHLKEVAQVSAYIGSVVDGMEFLESKVRNLKRGQAKSETLVDRRDTRSARRRVLVPMLQRQAHNLAAAFGDHGGNYFRVQETQ
jgi:hypothetical protein